MAVGRWLSSDITKYRRLPLTSQKIDGAPQRVHEELRPRDLPTDSFLSPEHMAISLVLFIQPVNRQMTSPRYRALC